MIFEKVLSIDDFLPESIEIINEYKCPLCEGITFDPVTDACGHIFCAKCFETYLSNSQHICPITKKHLKNNRMNHITTISNLLNKQMIRCRNKLSGCEWVGKLFDLEAHTSKECRKETIKCLNQGCSQFGLREEMEKHANECESRIVKCIYCFNYFPFNQIVSHEEECPRMKMCCPQKCQKVLHREEIRAHIEKECVNTEITCPYAEFCCVKEKFPRGSLNDHLVNENVKHISSSMREIATNNKALIGLKKDMASYFDKLNRKMDELIDISHQLEEREAMPQVIPPFEIPSRSILVEMPQIQFSLLEVPAVTIVEPIQMLRKESLLQIESKSPEESTVLLGKKTSREPPRSHFNELSLDGEEREGDEAKDAGEEIEEGEEIENTSFDIALAPKGISITKNKARCTVNSKKEHLFVFGSLPVANKEEDIIKWKVKVISVSGWMGLGVGCKETILKNKSQIVKPNHGVFCITSKGFIWHSNNPNENNSLIPDFPTIKKGDKLKFSYSVQRKELRIRLGNNKKVKLDNVFSNVKGSLVPCVLFINLDDEVELDYY